MLHPLTTRVLIRPIVKADQTASGLFLVEHDPGVTAGTVMATGPAVTCVVPGEVVIFPRYAGQDITDGDTDYLLLNDEDLSAVVTADPTECPYCCRPFEDLHG